MSILFVDVETTNITPGNICQLSYISLTEQGGVSAKNHYFTVDKINPYAQGVHGLSLEILRKLSENKRFEAYGRSIHT